MWNARALRRLIRLPWRSRARIERDIDDEFQFHLDMRVAELVARGLAPEDAGREAARRFGSVDDAREYCRSMDERSTTAQHRRDLVAELGSDIRFAVRQMRRSPIFTALAVITLSLGIGATTAIFSVVNRLLLNPIPFADGDRIVNLLRSNLEGNLYVVPTPKLVEAWRNGVRSLEHVATYGHDDAIVAGRDEDEEMPAGRLSADVLPMLQVKPLIGRGILPEDTKIGAQKVVVLGYGFWQRRYAGSRGVLGESITIDSASRTIVGVMPRDFAVPFMDGGARQIWLPLEENAEAEGAQAIAKMRPGVSREQVNRELTDIMRALGAESPEFKEWKGLALRPQDYLGPMTRDNLLILLGAVGMVLLIACANVANLLLARAATREREFAIRAALGAGRWRIIRQLLTESAMLAIAGGALGVFVAQRGLDLIIAMRPDRLSELDEVRLSPTVLLVSLGLTLVTGLLFGLAPALFAAARDIGHALKNTTRSAAGHLTARRFRGALVVAEVSLSVLLLVGAGLLIRTMVKMQRADIGFEASGLVAADVRLPEARFPKREQRRVAFEQIVQRMRATPGLGEVTWSMGMPPRTGMTFGKLEIEGRTLKPDEQESALWSQFAAPEYFRVMRLPLVAGRSFSADTGRNAVIVSETMARRFWPGTSAVGRRLRLMEKAEWSTVVGVARDVTVPSTGGKGDRRRNLQIYFPFSGDFESATLIIRTGSAVADLPRRLAREAATVDPAIRVRDVTTADQTLAKELAGPRFNMSLLLVFAGLALMLATIGLYGVIAYSVSQRTRELGIRLALGAGRTAVLRLVISQGARLTLTGVVVGLAAASGLTRLIQGMLYGVGPLDPMTFVVVGVVLGVVALLASYFPARRATRVDPVIALRAE
jgi:putative ABC transport system permease protein